MLAHAAFKLLLVVFQPREATVQFVADFLIICEPQLFLHSVMLRLLVCERAFDLFLLVQNIFLLSYQMRQLIRQLRLVGQRFQIPLVCISELVHIALVALCRGSSLPKDFIARRQIHPGGNLRGLCL